MGSGRGSDLSSETVAVQRLGFDTQVGMQRVLASILNRIKPSWPILFVLGEIIVFSQMIGLGFHANADTMLSENEYTNFVGQIAQACVTMGEYDSGHEIMITLSLTALVVWGLVFIVFFFYYKRTKTFYTWTVYFLYAVGYWGFIFLQVFMSTATGYFIRSIVNPASYTDSLWSFLGIATWIGWIVVSTYMVHTVHSSPTIDVRNKFSFWPQDYLAIMYRVSMVYGLGMVLEVIREMGEYAVLAGHCITITCGVIGMIIIWKSNSNVFSVGRVVAATQYLMLVIAPLVSIVYDVAGGDPLVYLVVFTVFAIVGGVTQSVISMKLTKKKIDLLYSKYETLIDSITTPRECIMLVRIGIVFSAPCVIDRTLLQWAIARWPCDQRLLLMISYVYFVLGVPYRDLLELVSVAVDVEPFSMHDGLLFYQIFSRIPIRERFLTKRLEGLHRLYDLPRTSLRLIWEAVLAKQWDEVLMNCVSYGEDLDHATQVFANLRFENPTSDCILREYIKFATEIQGNHAAAKAAQVELARRTPTEEVNEMVDVTETLSQMSRLSSAMWSTPGSESDQLEGGDRAQNGVRMAVLARPVFWPKRLMVCVIAMIVVSLASAVAQFISVNGDNTEINSFITFSGRLHDMARYSIIMLFESIEFAAAYEGKDQASMTVSGEEWNIATHRKRLIDTSFLYDEALAECLGAHAALPITWLPIMTTEPVEICETADPDDALNASIISVVEVFCSMVRTVAYAPSWTFNPERGRSPEVFSVLNVYVGVRSAVNSVSQMLSDHWTEHYDEYLPISVIAVLSALAVNVLIGIIAAPIIIVGIVKEFDFFVSLYVAVPQRIVRKVLEQEEDDMQDDEDQERQVKRLLPLRLYMIWEILAIFLILILFGPFCSVFMYLHHSEQFENAYNTLHSMQMITKLLLEVGQWYLHSFKIVTGFTSTLSAFDECQALFAVSDLVVDTDHEIFYGETEWVPKGFVSEDFEADYSCTEILGNGLINHSCTLFHDSMHYIYGHGLRTVARSDRVPSYDAPNSTVNGVWWRILYPVLFNAMHYGSAEYGDFYMEKAGADMDQSNTYNMVTLLFSLLFGSAVLVVSFAFARFRLEAHIRSLMRPLVMMNPAHIEDSRFILRFLQGDFDSAARQTARDVGKKDSDTVIPLVDFLLEGVLVVSSDGTVIASNRKYHEMMSNTAEEVIGRNIRAILSSAYAPLIDTLGNMKAGTNVTENPAIDGTLTTSGDKELNVTVTLVSEVGQETNSRRANYAFLIRDKSELIRDQNRLRKEKVHVERLLEQVLPNTLATAVIGGRSEVSFQAEKACILNMNIVSFTPLSLKMRAKSIITTLNLLFSDIDRARRRLPRITRLRTNGDMYMAVSGVFESDGSIEASVADMIELAMAIMALVPEMATKYDRTMHLRIGIHVGGPMICGLLSKDRPVFEVFGSQLTVVEELQSTAPHDAIHVSQAVVDLIRGTKIEVSEHDGAHPQSLEGQKTWVVRVPE